MAWIFLTDFRFMQTPSVTIDQQFDAHRNV